MDCCIGVVAFGAEASLFALMAEVRKAYPALACAVVDHTESTEEAAAIAAEASRHRWTYMHRENYGFAAGVQALLDGAAPHAFLFVVNPDVEFRSFDAFETCWEVVRSAPQTFAIGTTLHDPAGQPVAGVLPPFDVRLLLSRGKVPLPKVSAVVSAVHGAFFGLNVATMRRVGGLDASLFLYAEEFDLAQIARKHGGQIRFLPTTGVVHHGESRPVRPMQVLMNRANLLYLARKWRKPLLIMGFSLGLLLRPGFPLSVRFRAWRWALRPVPADASSPHHGAASREFWSHLARNTSNSEETAP
jgi:GT2 family glycosyltransferase